MSSEFAWLISSYGYVRDAKSFFSLAKELEGEGNIRIAAIAYDRAHELDPYNREIMEARQKLLDRLAVVEYGIRFRYIPAGSFLMGSKTGDTDEQPVHSVELSEFWISETPVSWAVYSDLMGWGSPPDPYTKDFEDKEHMNHNAFFFLREEDKIRLQYCEDATKSARDWHAHRPGHDWVDGTGQVISSRVLFGEPSREDPRRPWQYDRKPMVSVSWQEAEELCKRLSTDEVLYRLPTEAEWEKAARGALISCQYPWGDDPPNEDRCDFNRFNEFSILPMRRFPPNSYGLYAMSGCIWEWISDWYDAQYYSESPQRNPSGPPAGEEKVLRGGSWADCAEAVTVSFRMSRQSKSWRTDKWGGHFTPNIGFRLCRVERNGSD